LAFLLVTAIAFNLDPRVARQTRRLHGRPRRFIVAEKFGVNFVHRRKVVHIRKNTVVLTTLFKSFPPLREPRSDFSKLVWFVPRHRLTRIRPVAGSIGICPEQKIIFPALTACEYGPIAPGAFSVEIVSFTNSFAYV
jgi:hypothetical protein